MNNYSMIYDDDISKIEPGTVLYEKPYRRSVVVYKIRNKNSYKEFYVFYTSSITLKGRYAIVGELDLKSRFDVVVW